MNAPCAGLIFDDSVHYLDHLAPFCAQMGWPLIVCEPSIVERSVRFYPMVDVIHTDFSGLCLPPCIVSCNSHASIMAALGPFSSWNGRVIWLPHGQSDKGWKSRAFEALGKEALLLVYGERMRQVLEKHNVRIPQQSIGHFRWQFYETHRVFYNDLVDQVFGQRRFVLYAPTWDDSEQTSSFWDAFEPLIRSLPSSLHLVIKVHPNTQERFPAQLERAKGKIEGRANVTFVEDFPPIYPLLDRTDAYIGDTSSIGYDYLRFGGPLFFLTRERMDPREHPGAYLMQWGKQIAYDEIGTLFSRIASQNGNRGEGIFDDIKPEERVRSIRTWVASWK